MGRWIDLAPQQEKTGNQGGDMSEQRGVVLHIAQGSYAGTIAWQKNPAAAVSSHFIAAKDGRAAQMVDTDRVAWTQKAGNGHWLSIENEGSVPDKLTAAQVEFAAQILARAHTEYGVPLQVASTPDGRGLGHHSMGANPGSPDDWGHSACPGTNIINQKAAIVARAKEIVTVDPREIFATDNTIDNDWPEDKATNAQIQAQTEMRRNSREVRALRETVTAQGKMLLLLSTKLDELLSRPAGAAGTFDVTGSLTLKEPA